mgnify:CR=1 FL=1
MIMDKKVTVKLFKEVIIITAVAAVIGFIVNLYHPKGYIFISRSKLALKRIVYINTQEAKIKYDSKQVVFIDSRSESEFRNGHIKGAINIPLRPEDVFIRNVIRYKSIISSLREIVIYCSGASCGSSVDLAKRLIQKGYKRNLYVLRDGYPGWKSDGLPVGFNK